MPFRARATLRRMAGDASRLQLTELTELTELTGDAVADLVAMLAGGQPDDNLLRLADGAAGNPLYLTELRVRPWPRFPASADPGGPVRRYARPAARCLAPRRGARPGRVGRAAGPGGQADAGGDRRAGRADGRADAEMAGWCGRAAGQTMVCVIARVDRTLAKICSVLRLL
jgi:hypothetical protein